MPTLRTVPMQSVGGNGFRAVGVIDALEQTLDRPMLTANQALLWGALRAAESGAAVHGYGCLFDTIPGPQSA